MRRDRERKQSFSSESEQWVNEAGLLGNGLWGLNQAGGARAGNKFG